MCLLDLLHFLLQILHLLQLLHFVSIIAFFIAAFCDVALTVAIPRWNESIKDDITQLVKEEGINNFKVYMAFKNELMLTNEELLDLFDHCKSLGAVVHVHAENGTIIAENEKRLRAK